MTDVEFYWDPVCPWAWITSRWLLNVMEQKPLEVDWRFISLRLVNENKSEEKDFPARYERLHIRGLELLRVAAALRARLGREAVLPLYSLLGRRIHNEGNGAAFDEAEGIEAALSELGYPVDLAAAASSHEYDEVIRSETEEALDCCGGNVGTPVIRLSPPDGPSFFGPVINRAPGGQEALDLWEAVRALGYNPYFSELKRSIRGRPTFDD